MTPQPVLRTMKYLSSSSHSKFESDRPLFFEQYLCPVKKKRPPQIDFMGVGSGFDARVKSQIHEDVFGKEATKGSQFEFQKIFEEQVEPHVRDVVMHMSTYLWQEYVKSGAYANLLSDIVKSPHPPQMEFTVKSTVGGVPMLGKPDLRYITKEDVNVICDWKVNGSMSKTGASPMQGYRLCLATFKNKTNGKSHMARRLKVDPVDKKYQDYTSMMLRDVECNVYYLEESCAYWADQLAMYAWLLGEQVGSETFVIRMEQIACRPTIKQPMPRVKFATHMSRVSKGYQEALMARLAGCWATIESGHIFTDVPRERSDEICRQLTAKAKMPIGLHPSLSRIDNSVRFK